MSKLKVLLQDKYEQYLQFRARSEEIKKFRDPERKAIYETVELTEAQRQKIDDFYISNYGKKVPHTWHRHFTAFTGNFDPEYFPELLFIPEFERFMNDQAYASVFSDKNLLPLIAKSRQVKMPQTILSRINGQFQDRNMSMVLETEAISLLSDVGKVFAKPSVDTSSGQGCMLLNIMNGKDLENGKSVREIFQELGENFCVQTCITCHDSIKALHPESVNTFRVITYIWKNEIVSMPIIMRIGVGKSSVDNAHAGGIFIAVSDDGILHKTAFTEFKKVYDKHPDSGIVFEGYQIPDMRKVLSAAKKMHEAMCQIGIVNWDFTIDETGEPVLIEANINGGSIWLLEMAHGVGCFGERTAEILRWVRFMKTVPLSKRKDYLYGNMERR